MTNANNHHHHANNAVAANQPHPPQQQQHQRERQSNEEDDEHQQPQQQQQRCTVRLCGSSFSPCGYCSGQRASVVFRGRNDSSKSYGMLISSHLSAQNYCKLIHQGWRRSGQHLYKPDNWNSCCPALTIRLPVTEFQPTRSQRRVVSKMMRLLDAEGTTVASSASFVCTKSPRNAAASKPSHGDEMPILTELADWTRAALQEILTHTTIQQPIRYKTTSTDDETITAVSTICAAVAGPSKGKYDRGVLASQVVQRLNLKLNNANSTTNIEVQAHEPSGQIICKLSTKNLHTDHTLEQQNLVVSMETERTTTPADLLDDWFRTHVPQSTIQRPYTLTMTTHSAAISSLQPEVHQLYLDYQQKVHNDASPLSEHDEADWGDAPPAYIEQARIMLRRTYPNLTPHEMLKMSASFSSFYRFLVETPLSSIVQNNNQTSSSNNNHANTGTFHQHYRINGILIAVGVVDILTEGLSSVYAFYDADFAHSLCPLGKFLILKEIEYCRDHNLRYYYLGYYIHSCTKMRYKAEYHPSQLLCPVTYRWVDAQEGQETIDTESPERQCCRLYHGPVEDDDANEVVETAVSESILLQVGLPYPVTVSMLYPSGQEIVRPLVTEFVHHVGADVSRECVLKLV